MDGTKKRDESGDEISVYDQEDIMSMARAFTGLMGEHWHHQNIRGNVEKAKWQENLHVHYPGARERREAQSQATKRDIHPKTDLYGGYIGDGVGLCSDLPDR